jgi:hypothetical protein
LFRQMLHAVRKADQIERGLDLFAALAPAQTREQQRQLDIFIRRQDRQQIERLENEPDILIPPIGQLRLIQFGDIDALHVALPARRPIDAGEDVQQRGFAGTGRPHEREKFAGSDIERDVIQRGHLNLTLRVKLGEVADADDVAVGGHATIKPVSVERSTKSFHDHCGDKR